MRPLLGLYVWNQHRAVLAKRGVARLRHQFRQHLLVTSFAIRVKHAGRLGRVHEATGGRKQAAIWADARPEPFRNPPVRVFHPDRRSLLREPLRRQHKPAFRAGAGPPAAEGDL